MPLVEVGVFSQRCVVVIEIGILGDGGPYGGKEVVVGVGEVYTLAIDQREPVLGQWKEGAVLYGQGEGS